MKRWLWGGAGVVVLGIAIEGLAGNGGLIPRSMAAPAGTTSAAEEDRLIVHESGTFTSYSGSNSDPRLTTICPGS